MKFFIQKPPNGMLLGPDVTAQIFPCGCRVECLDDGLHITTCTDPYHQQAHRETCLLMAKEWNAEVIES